MPCTVFLPRKPKQRWPNSHLSSTVVLRARFYRVKAPKAGKKAELAHMVWEHASCAPSASPAPSVPTVAGAPRTGSASPVSDTPDVASVPSPRASPATPPSPASSPRLKKKASPGSGGEEKTSSQTVSRPSFCLEADSNNASRGAKAKSVEPKPPSADSSNSGGSVFWTAAVLVSAVLLISGCRSFLLDSLCASADVLCSHYLRSVWCRRFLC